MAETPRSTQTDEHRTAATTATGAVHQNPFHRLARTILLKTPLRTTDTPEIRGVVTETLGEDATDEPSALVGFEGVHTASLFFDETARDPTLTWYLELDRSVAAARGPCERWLVDELRTNAPLYDGGLEQLENPARSTVIGGSLSAPEVITHRWHPERPRAPISVADESVEAASKSGEAASKLSETASKSGEAASKLSETASKSGEAASKPSEGGPALEVALVDLPVKPGVASWVLDRLAARPPGASGGWIERTVSAWEEAILRAEGMYTETLFLDRTGDELTLRGFMEAESFERVYAAYSETWNPMARGTEIAMRLLLEEPDRVLSPTPARSNRLLAHAVGPNRPRTWRLRQR